MTNHKKRKEPEERIKELQTLIEHLKSKQIF